jgi:nitroreductase
MLRPDYLAAWRTAEEAFPRTGTAAARLGFLATYAVLAPSVHNTQPWIFRLRDEALELHLDRRRALPVIDPRNRALIISCGAALFNLRTALYYFGCGAEAHLFPDPQQPDLLARVALTGRTVPAGTWSGLFHAILHRVTNRGPFDVREVAPPVIDDLRNAARVEGAWLCEFRTPHARKQIEALVAEGSRIQYGNADFRHELADWLRPAGDPEGIPRHAIGETEQPDYLTSAIPFLLRSFDVGRKAAARYNKLAAEAPVLACLGTARDDPLAWLNAGQALQRVLLTATTHGLQASFLNQPIEVNRLRYRLDALIEHRGQPQMILRLGRGRRRIHTPRREMEDVLVRQPGERPVSGDNGH